MSARVALSWDEAIVVSVACSLLFVISASIVLVSEHGFGSLPKTLSPILALDAFFFFCFSVRKNIKSHYDPSILDSTLNGAACVCLTTLAREIFWRAVLIDASFLTAHAVTRACCSVLIFLCDPSFILRTLFRKNERVVRAEGN